MTGTRLLNDDGTASMATCIMMSHHAFRRDLAHFASALATLNLARVEALRGEWAKLDEELHGHHEAEDTGMFPGIREAHPELAATIEVLTEQHHRIGPLLARGKAAFAALPETHGAREVVGALAALLDEHLALGERTVLPMLRGAAQFPPLEADKLGVYAEGFAWAMLGIAPEVIAEVKKMLPRDLVARLPEARAAFAARWERVWGSAHASASTTSVPSE